MKRLLVLFLFVYALACTAQDVAVAAASDLNFALKEIAQHYQRDTGHSVTLSFGSSGNFFVQLQNGAPFDIFFSADIEYPQKLVIAGLADPNSLYRYAVGKIVLWAPRDSKLNLKQGMSVLLDPSIKKIAIANPAHAPYGRAAEEAMMKAGVYEGVKNKLVLGENISQAAQFVETGNAEIGIIAQSLALAPNMTSSVRYEAVPQNFYTPIEQAAVILKTSKNKAAAKAFLDYVKSPTGRQVLAKYGFAVPGQTK